MFKTNLNNNCGCCNNFNQFMLLNTQENSLVELNGLKSIVFSEMCYIS